MSALFLVCMAVLTLGGFIQGYVMAERGAVSMWRTHGYCPTCDRLTTEQEADGLEHQ